MVKGQECHADWDILEPQVGNVAEFLVHEHLVLEAPGATGTHFE